MRVILEFDNLTGFYFNGIVRGRRVYRVRPTSLWAAQQWVTLSGRGQVHEMVQLFGNIYLTAERTFMLNVNHLIKYIYLRFILLIHKKIPLENSCAYII